MNSGPGIRSFDRAALERALGAPLGPTLMALAEHAFALAPTSPGSAFDALWFQLPWLESNDDPAVPWWAGSGTPKNVLPFAYTGGDLVHFGFLLDHPGPTEHRPIVCVDPADGAHVVAPNLNAFLGLLSLSLGEVIGRHAGDERWFSFRREWYGDEPAHLAKLEALSQVLLSIPGVTRPEHPGLVATAWPDQPFELDFD